MVLKLIDKWCAWGPVGWTQCAEGIISMTVMHQSIILAVPMPLPLPPPPGISFFVLDGKFLGEGIVESSHAQMLCNNNWY